MEVNMESGMLKENYINVKNVPPTIAWGEALDEDGRPKRKGGFWEATAHIVTAVIGSGVLSLAWSMAKLGWVIGPFALLVFALITFYTSLLLADCYRCGTNRNYTYMDAVRAYLGG